MALIFIFINPNIANLNMAGSVLRSMSSVAIMALGLTLVIVVGEIDLSFGAIYGLAINALAVLWVVNGVPVYLAIPIAILVGALVGLFNGMLVTQLKIPSFIVTLGSYNLLYGITLWVSNTGHLQSRLSAARQDRAQGRTRFLRRADPGRRFVPPVARSRLDDRHRDRRRACCCTARCSASG